MSTEQQIQLTFFERHQAGLAEVFDTLEVPEAAKTDLDVAVEHTQPWIKGDHGRQGHIFNVATEASDRLYDLYAQFGQRDEVQLPAGQYDEVLMLGGLQAGNRRRLNLLRRAMEDPDVQIDRIALLGGQRYLFPEKEKDDLWDAVEGIGNRGGTWVEHAQRQPADKLWETDGIRLAAIEQLGPMVLKRMDLRLYDISEAPEDPLAGYEFDLNGTPVSLTHTLAVARPNGDKRHTTEACMVDWLERRHPGPEQAATIGFIAANPHIERMGRSSQAMLHANGRDDLQLVVAGSAAPASLGHGFFLGEIARNLYEDQRQLRSQA